MMNLQNTDDRPISNRKQKATTSLAVGLALPLLLVSVLLATVTTNVYAASLNRQTNIPGAEATVSASGAAEVCDGGTGIPESECLALVDLFREAKGKTWSVNTNWLTASETISACDWYGINCAGGHVTGINLSSNGLSGNLPDSLAKLTSLTDLIIDRNAIGGTVGSSICNLADTLQQTDLDYNRLSASGNRSRTCLDKLDPGWSTTQTVAPTDLRVDSIDETAIVLNWNPIDYVADGGYYVVGISTSLDGPYTNHGQTADKQTSSYQVDGLSPGRTYYVRVRTYTPAHGEQTNELLSDYVPSVAVTASPQSILLAVYFGADNDLDSYARVIQARLIRGTLINPNVTVVALINRRGDDNTQVWTIANGIATVDGGFLSSLGVSEVDTSDPKTLSAFLKYAKSLVEADVTVASIIGHGVGLAPELTGFVENNATIDAASANQGIPALPRQKDHTPTDVTSGSYMSTPELGRALAAATDNGADPFDLIFFDQCFAGNLDVLYEVRTAAKIFVASPNYAWLVAPYARYIAEFSPDRTTEQMAGGIITTYQRSLNDRHPNAILAIRSADITAVAAAVDSLATTLIAAVNAGEATKISVSSVNSRFVDTTQCGEGNLALGPPDEMIGAETFAANLQQAFGPGDAHGVHAAAGDLIAALDEIWSNHRVGTPYIEPDEYWDYDDSITLLAPLARATRPGVAWRASIYREMEGEAAVWTPMPDTSVTLGSPFAYVKEGKWDEFIDVWYTEPMTPTVGQWCNYTPPSLVISGTVESMTLQIDAITEETVQLTWSEVPDARLGDYLVHARQPGDVSWTQVASLPASETTYDLAIRSDERHRFIIVATDVDGAIIAKSETIDWQGEGGTHQVYLPLIRR